MWVAGILQGLMWRAYTSLGFLEYSFIETVEAMHPFYLIRALGGFLFLVGAVLMVINVWKTIATPEADRGPRPGPAGAGPGRVRRAIDVALGQAQDPRDQRDLPPLRRAASSSPSAASSRSSRSST